MGSHVDRMLSTELYDDETLVWSGQSKQGLVFRKSDLLGIPLGLLFSWVAISWEYEAISRGSSWSFRLLGIPFVLAGCYIVFGRFIVDMVRRKHQYYGVTNERLIILWKLSKTHIKSLPLNTLSEISCIEKSDKTGSLIFGSAPSSWFASPPWEGMAETDPPRFEMIEDVRRVYDLIREVQKNWLA